MLDLTDGDRAFLIEMRGLTIDEVGREVFVGLSFEESQEYAQLSKPLLDRIPRDEDNERYIDLNNKYEAARQGVLAMEIVSRNSTITTH